ncbi:hypothetical protein A3Q56_04194 [Intoshia linei]|uniref:Uncharacterized protein n=1 Tax=Intoshia linei TaxID=1819745 RepID=A0A177B1B7_9BILA|nr:hypothetical protein A3Q56_04194 [Intoshia linei]
MAHGEIEPVDDVLDNSKFYWTNSMGQLTENGKNQIIELAQYCKEQYILTNFIKKNYQKNQLNISALFSGNAVRRTMNNDNNYYNLTNFFENPFWSVATVQLHSTYFRSNDYDRTIVSAEIFSSHFYNSKISSDYTDILNCSAIRPKRRFGSIRSCSFEPYCRKLFHICHMDTTDNFWKEIDAVTENSVTKENWMHHAQQLEYSDKTVLIALMNALKIYQNKLPGDASALIFELWQRNTDKYLIKIKYRDGTTKQTQNMRLLDCDELCSFSKFKDIHSHLITHNYDMYCEPASEEQNYFIIIIVLLVFFAIILLGMTIAIFHFMKKLKYELI